MLVIIQARMNSNRLPGKVLRELHGKPVLGWTIKRVREASQIKRIIVATSHHQSDDPIEDYCRSTGEVCYRGSLNNVANRFAEILKIEKAEAFVRISGDSPLIDPQIVEDVSGSDIIRDLFEGLLNQDADGNLVPGVAESWEANDAKDVYTFHLRNNAKWSNGDSVTAHDFVYAWQRAVDPATASPYSWFIEIMSIKNGAEAISGDVPPSDLGVKATLFRWN